VSVLLLLGSSLATQAPSTGLRDDLVQVKLAAGVQGRPSVEGATVRPLFSLRAQALGGELARWHRIEVEPGQGARLVERLEELDWVELATLAPAPVAPPVDLEPTTPDFSGYQTYWGAAPDGVGLDEARLWPAGDGRNVAVADLEYDWEDEHEDLEALIGAEELGWDSQSWSYHGNAVLSMLFSAHNGYGVDGGVPAARPVLVHPYTDAGDYDIAAMVAEAAASLVPGDVLLIEQQSWAHNDYAPVEVSPAVFDAIQAAVAAGLVVVEPAGNGAQDLDAGYWGGAFDRALKDSGAILVGGGNPPGVEPARAWSGGSCYGSRVDVQGWYLGIVSATTGDYSPDLFYPGGDGRQAYTSAFGGTSGASPMVSSVAAAFQSIHIELTGAPMDPLALRALMVSTGTPQQGSEPIGPQPDLRRMLRLGLMP
jgi:serine protease